MHLRFVEEVEVSLNLIVVSLPVSLQYVTFLITIEGNKHHHN